MAQDLSPAQRTLTVGVLGAGTVGSQVIRLLTEQADDFAARSGARLEITGVAVRDVNAPRDFAVPQDLLTDDATAVATGNDLVIELIGGIEPARTLILAAFKAGASVITGNKALIAAHGPELYTAAAAAGTDFYYEAAVAGAIPVVYALRESMAGDRVTSVLGIVNGTTNYILDEMSTKGLSFETALATAQELGYAEADPTADVDGLDAAAKAAIAGLTPTISEELIDAGITVNTVNPGPVDTGYVTEADREATAVMFPQGRWGEPDDAARIIAWLLTDEARWITGQVINSEGGFARWRR